MSARKHFPRRILLGVRARILAVCSPGGAAVAATAAPPGLPPTLAGSLPQGLTPLANDGRPSGATPMPPAHRQKLFAHTLLDSWEK